MREDDDDETVGTMDIRLVRHSFSQQGVQGFLYYEGQDEAAFATIELPWRNNERGASCIPRGKYDCVWARSPRFGMCYHVLDVPNRANILFHHGNYAGNTKLGLRSDSSGCILLGMKHGVLAGQRGVINSRAARLKFETDLGGEKFILTIDER